VAELRALGCSVAVLSGLGGGVPDLLIGFRGVNYLLEVKNLEGRGDKLTPAESAFFDSWAGQVEVIRDSDEAKKAVKLTG